MPQQSAHSSREMENHGHFHFGPLNEETIKKLVGPTFDATYEKFQYDQAELLTAMNPPEFKTFRQSIAPYELHKPCMHLHVIDQVNIVAYEVIKHGQLSLFILKYLSS